MKIGIYSGAFDPVHKGHVAFALKAAVEAGLDKVYFLPEAVPRRRESVTHYGHRVAMLKIATKPYQKLEVLEMPDKRFTVHQTLPRLQSKFKDAELHLLIGSDVVEFLGSKAWPGTDKLLKDMRLIVGVRGDDAQEDIAAVLQGIVNSRAFHIVQTDAKNANSSEIRKALTDGKTHESSLQSLERYIKQNWIYESIAP